MKKEHPMNRILACLSSVILTAALLAHGAPASAQGRTSFGGLGTLGGSSSEGRCRNASGQMTGYSYITGNSTQHAFLYSGGSMQDLGTLGGTLSFGNGINASGQVVGGAYLAGDAVEHAFLYS